MVSLEMIKPWYPRLRSALISEMDACWRVASTTASGFLDMTCPATPLKSVCAVRVLTVPRSRTEVPAKPSLKLSSWDIQPELSWVTT